MDFYAIMQSRAECARAAHILYQRFSNHPKIKDMEDKITIAPKDDEIWNFRIEFIRPLGCVHEIYGMSISYPSDLLGNRGKKYNEGFPSTIETALLGTMPNNDIFKSLIIYDENCGYENVIYFPRNDLDGLIEHVIRISNYLSTPLADIVENQTHDDLDVYQEDYEFNEQSNKVIVEQEI